MTTMEEREETFYQILQKSWRSSVLILTFLELGDCPTGQIFNLHIPTGIPEGTEKHSLCKFYFQQ